MASKTMRLDKILSHMKMATRTELKKLARKGLILVNGEVITDTSLHFDPDSVKIEVDGQEVKFALYKYWMMNKPTGVVSATYDGRDQTVLDLMAAEDAKFEPFPVGRLDKDTEGLLLLTNDGELSHFLLSPRFHVPKTYSLEVRGILSQESVIACEQGLILDDGLKTLPARLRILSVDQTTQTSKAEIIIHEGKYHQVKRMMEVLQCEVTYLKRTIFGPLYLDSELTLGSYRPLREEEVQALRDAV
jgi:16S rRNA pseudouridine516 synthase